MAALEVDGDEQVGLPDDALASEDDPRPAHHDGARRPGGSAPGDPIGEPRERCPAKGVGIRRRGVGRVEQACELAPRPLDGADGARVEAERAACVGCEPPPGGVLYYLVVPLGTNGLEGPKGWQGF